TSAFLLSTTSSSLAPRRAARVTSTSGAAYAVVHLNNGASIKSISLTITSSVFHAEIITLAGLRSPWLRPFPCKYAIPSAMPFIISHCRRSHKIDTEEASDLRLSSSSNWDTSLSKISITIAKSPA
ncbi:hypothetical protein KC19_7G048600, partial [Ceratodon purpureus]